MKLCAMCRFQPWKVSTARAATAGNPDVRRSTVSASKPESLALRLAGAMCTAPYAMLTILQGR